MKNFFIDVWRKEMGKKFFMIMSSTNNYHVACCKEFIEILLKYRILNSIKHKLISECFHIIVFNYVF